MDRYLCHIKMIKKYIFFSTNILKSSLEPKSSFVIFTLDFL